MSSRKLPSIVGLLLKPEAVRALQVLVRAVADAGDRVPCRRDPKAWTGDNPEPGLREGAAHLCQRCPALAECDDYATTARERWGVWGGRDRTPPPRSPEEPPDMAVGKGHVLSGKDARQHGKAVRPLQFTRL